MQFFRIFILLVFIFSLSILVRLPFLNNQVRSGNFGHIITLTTLENWETQGLKACHFSPVLTWNNPADKFIAFYKRVEDKNGNNYFISFPPFAFLFVYFIFKIIHSVPNQITLEILALLLHFISAFFIFKIIQNVPQKNENKNQLPGILGFTAFCFFPPLLYHGFNFFPDLVVIPMWLAGILFFIKYFLSENNPKLKQYVIIFILNFLMIYTEWIGILFAFTICIICILNFKKDYKYLQLLKTTIISSFVALLLIFFQYLSINGFYSLFRGLSLRFLERSGWFGNHYSDQALSFFNLKSYCVFLLQFHHVFLGLGYLLILMIAIVCINKYKKNNFRISSKNSLIFILCFLPIFLHFIFLFNSNILHFGEWAKLGVPVSVGIGIAVNKLSKSISFKKINIFIFVFIFCSSVFLSVRSFYHYMSLQPDDTNFYRYSEIIKKKSLKNEAIFVKNNIEPPQSIVFLSYLVKRNIMFAADTNDVKKILKEKNKSNGAFFTFDINSCSFQVEHLIIMKPQ